MERKELGIEWEPVESLAPYAMNAKEHSAEQVEQIAASIREFGFNDPVAVWTNADGCSEIVEGHGRVMAAQLLGMDVLPVIHLDALTDEQRRAYTHVHNQTTLSSGFDWDVLTAEIDALPEFDWQGFGFDVVGIDGFGQDFTLPDGDAPQFKTVSLHLTAEQHALLAEALSGIERGGCKLQGGNESGDKVCEAVRQWAGL